VRSVAVCCSVLRCFAVFCSVVLQCCSVLQCFAGIRITRAPVRTLLFARLNCAFIVAVFLQLQCFSCCVAVFFGVLRCVAVRCSRACPAKCCSVLQCVAVCCSVLQCVAVCCKMLQCVAVYGRVWRCIALRCNRSVAVQSSVAVCCSVLQFTAVRYSALQSLMSCRVLQCVAVFAVCCCVLQCFAIARVGLKC